MRRREFVSLLSGAALIPFAAHAQQNERVRRIGVIGVLAKDDPEAVSRVAAFQQALASAAGRMVGTYGSTTGGLGAMRIA